MCFKSRIIGKNIVLWSKIDWIFWKTLVSFRLSLVHNMVKKFRPRNLKGKSLETIMHSILTDNIIDFLKKIYVNVFENIGFAITVIANF